MCTHVFYENESYAEREKHILFLNCDIRTPTIQNTKCEEFIEWNLNVFY